MKTKRFLVLLGSAVMVLALAMTSCKKDSSSDPTPSPDPKPSPDPDPDPSDDTAKAKALLLNGDKYYTFFIGATAQADIQSKIVGSFGPNDQSINFWWWNNAYTSTGTCVGLNAFGYSDGWQYLIAGDSWCSNGLCITSGDYPTESAQNIANATAMWNEVAKDPDNWYFCYSSKRDVPMTEQKNDDGIMEIPNQEICWHVSSVEVKFDLKSIPADGKWRNFAVAASDTDFDFPSGSSQEGSANIWTNTVGKAQEFQVDNIFLMHKTK